MVRYAVAGVMLMIGAADVLEAATARSMYLVAVDRERAVRTALKDLPPAPANAAEPANTAAAQRGESILREMHATVAAYEGLVRRYPASGYADDALWHAGLL